MTFLDKPSLADVALNTVGPQPANLLFAVAFNDALAGDAVAGDLTAVGTLVSPFDNPHIVPEGGVYGTWSADEGGRFTTGSGIGNRSHIAYGTAGVGGLTIANGTLLTRFTLGTVTDAVFVSTSGALDGGLLRLRIAANINATLALRIFLENPDSVIEYEHEFPFAGLGPYTVVATWGSGGFNAWVNGVASARNGTFADVTSGVTTGEGQEMRSGRLADIDSQKQISMFMTALWDVALLDSERQQLEADPHMMIRRKAPLGPQFARVNYTTETTARVVVTTELADTTARRFRLYYGETEAAVAAELRGSSIVVSTTDSGPEKILFELDGLSPGTKYYYKIKYDLGNENWYDLGDSSVATGSSAGGAHIGKFKTSIARGYRARFVILGDLHTDGGPSGPVLGSRDNYIARLAHTLSAAAAYNPDFFVAMGDYDFGRTGLTIENGSPEAETHLNDMRALMDYFTYLQVVGNHETTGTYKGETLYTAGRTIHTAYFGSPTNHSSHGGYFQYSGGAVDLFVIEPYTGTLEASTLGWDIDDDELAWLRESILASTATWKLVLSHQLLGGVTNYGRGAGTSIKIAGTAMATKLHPLFVELGVDAFLFDHDHILSFERVDDVAYICLGSPTSVFDANIIGATAFQAHRDCEFSASLEEEAFGYMRGSADSGRLYLEYHWVSNIAAESQDSIIFAREFTRENARNNPRTARDVLGLDEVRGAWVEPNVNPDFSYRSPAAKDADPSGGTAMRNVAGYLQSRS